MAILRIISPSPPRVPPAYLFTPPCPPDSCETFCAISWSCRCQVDPCGASVPSLMRTGAARAAPAPRDAQRTARAAKRLCMRFPRSIGKDVAFVREQELRAAAGEHVGETIL